jgi:hypothetical protein
MMNHQLYVRTPPWTKEYFMVIRVRPEDPTEEQMPISREGIEKFLNAGGKVHWNPVWK